MKSKSKLDSKRVKRIKKRVEDYIKEIDKRVKELVNGGKYREYRMQELGVEYIEKKVEELKKELKELDKYLIGGDNESLEKIESRLNKSIKYFYILEEGIVEGKSNIEEYESMRMYLVSNIEMIKRGLKSCK